jgi:hypothetical protein
MLQVIIMRCLTYIIVLITPLISLGQYYDSDPYKFNGSLLFNIECEKDEILLGEIEQVEVWTYQLKKDSTSVKDSTLDQKILFNECGLPVTYHSENTNAVWWWPAFKRKIGLENVRTETYDYKFDYDSLNRLIHVREYYNSGYGAYDKNDIQNEYDSQNRLIFQLIEEKNIYPRDFKFRGVAYTNDTNRITIQILYEEERVKSIFRTSDDYNHLTYNNRNDTLTFDCSTDSVNIKEQLSQGTELDSLNRISTTIMFAKSVSHQSYYVESENDIIYSYYYNEQGKIAKIEVRLRSGKYLSTKLFEYYDNLIQMVWSTNSLTYTKYKYKKLPVIH